MLDAILATLGLAAAYWGLSSRAHREELRIRFRVRRRAYRRLGWVAIAMLVVVMLVWIVVGVVAAKPDIILARVEAIGLPVVVLIACAGVLLLLDGAWNPDASAAFNSRVAPLLRSGQDGVVAAVLAKPMASLQKDEDIWHLGLDLVLYQCFQWPTFAPTLVREQPEAAASLLRFEHRVVLDSSDGILLAAFTGSPSILSGELAQSQNFAPSRVGYRVPSDALFLRTLFDDCRVAERLQAWRPVGEGMLRELTERRFRKEFDTDNLPWYEDDDQNSWRSPIGSGLWFFRVMLTSSLRQGILWHMWLFYLPEFVGGLLTNAQIRQESAWQEFPSRYFYYIADTFEILEELATTPAALPFDHPHRQPVEPTGDHDNASIPKSAVIAYTYCLDKLLECESVPQRFRSLRIDGAVSLWHSLRSSGTPEGLAEAFEAALGMMTHRERLEQEIERIARTEVHREEFKDLLKCLHS